MEQREREVDGIAAGEFADRRGACAERVRALGLDALVVTSPGDLRYLVGYSGVSTLGPNPFCAGPAAALVLFAGGDATLCAGEPDLALAGTPVDSVGALAIEQYETFGGLDPLSPRRRLSEAIGRALDSARIVGFQPASLPANVQPLLAEREPAMAWCDAGEVVMTLRMRKSRAELALIRRAIAVCDASQAAVAGLVREGQSQGALYDELRAIVYRAAGGSVPCILEASLGPAPEGDPDGRNRVVRAGDLVLTDIAPRVGAYWGDSCKTQTLQPPTDVQAAMLATVRDTLDRATDAVRPGLRVADLDTLMRDGIGRRYPTFPGGGGHGIGLDFHESPRLVPTETATIAEGMVIAMEPAIYLPDAAVRLEHVVAVTEDGCAVLSGHLRASDRTG
jgi:Xaa-Pro aminopeptidase